MGGLCLVGQVKMQTTNKKASHKYCSETQVASSRIVHSINYFRDKYMNKVHQKKKKYVNIVTLLENWKDYLLDDK